MIAQIIREYISQNRRLTIPGLGTILSTGEGAEPLFVEFASSDDDLLRMLLIERGVVEIEAIAMIEDYVAQAHRTLDDGGVFEIEGLGELVRSEEGAILFASMAEYVDMSGSEVKESEELEMEYEEDEVEYEEEEAEYEEEEYEEDEYEEEESPKREKNIPDLLMIISVIAIIFAILVVIYSQFVSWQIGELVLPQPIDDLMMKIFGDGLSGIENVEVE
ncbi:MAG: hypothetical protein SNF68_01245 [Rikenellaceae bacterium]